MKYPLPKSRVSTAHVLLVMMSAGLSAVPVGACSNAADTDAARGGRGGAEEHPDDDARAGEEDEGGGSAAMPGGDDDEPDDAPIGGGAGGVAGGGGSPGSSGPGGAPGAGGAAGAGNSGGAGGAPAPAMRSPGCGKPRPANPPTIAGRQFVSFIPQSYDPQQALALVFGFHGRGGNGSGVRNQLNPGGDGIEAASAGKAIFVYPFALPREDGRPAWEANPNSADLVFFDNLLTAITESYCIDMRRIFATGFSSGGMMSNRVGCSRAQVVRAIAPIEGAGPVVGSPSTSTMTDANCGGPVAAFIIHSMNDRVLPWMPSGQATTNHWTAANGCGTERSAGSTPDCEAFAGCRPGAPVELCFHDEVKNENDGHITPSWAGRVIWRFFDGLPTL